MTKQKTFRIKISRDFLYEYEVKAKNEDLEDAGVYPNVFENSILIEDKDFPYEEEEYEKYID